jgi:hypothetical protein
MDAIARRQHHARLRVLPHIKRLDDALGDFLVRVTCMCGTCRHIEPEALARIAEKSLTPPMLATIRRVLTASHERVRVGAAETKSEVETKWKHRRIDRLGDHSKCLI